MSVNYKPHQGWIVCEPIRVLIAEGWVEVPRGYHTDLSSIPVPIRWLPGFDDHSFGLAAPCVHDVAYRNEGQLSDTITVTRGRADDLYRILAVADGVEGWRARTAWCALRLFGLWAWHRLPVREQALRLAR